MQVVVAATAAVTAAATTVATVNTYLFLIPFLVGRWICGTM
jgi:hypothetical protein